MQENLMECLIPHDKKMHPCRPNNNFHLCPTSTFPTNIKEKINGHLSFSYT